MVVMSIEERLKTQALLEPLENPERSPDLSGWVKTVSWLAAKCSSRGRLHDSLEILVLDRIPRKCRAISFGMFTFQNNFSARLKQVFAIFEHVS